MSRSPATPKPAKSAKPAKPAAKAVSASKRRAPAPRSYGGISGDVRRAERRERFLQAGIQLFGTEGYSATTTRNLCAEAGLTQRYFYESFDSLDTLFIEVVNTLGAALQQRLITAIGNAPDHPEARIDASLRAYFAGIREDARVGRILLAEIYGAGGRVEPMVRGFVAGFAEIMRANLVTAFPVLATQRAVDIRMLSAGCIGATHHIALNWVLGGYTESLESVVDTVRCIYTGAVREAMGDTISDVISDLALAKSPASKKTKPQKH